ncbi:Protein TOL-1, partial [Aphelenchoides avenae]
MLFFLQILNVSHNELSDVRLGTAATECVLDHLIILDLSGNRIRHIGSGELASFPSVRQLSLSANGLREIDLDAFQSTALLQRLDLDQNMLRDVVPLPESIVYLNLAANELATIPAT